MTGKIKEKETQKIDAELNVIGTLHAQHSNTNRQNNSATIGTEKLDQME